MAIFSKIYRKRVFGLSVDFASTSSRTARTTRHHASLPRRALTLPVLKLLTCLWFSFSRIKSTPNLAAAPFCCPQISCFRPFESPGRLRPFGALDTTLQPPIGFCSAQYCIRFLCFPPHVRLPQAFWGAHRGLLALSHTWFSSPTTSGCVRDALRDVWREWSCASFLTYFVVVFVSVMRSMARSRVRRVLSSSGVPGFSNTSVFATT